MRSGARERSGSPERPRTLTCAASAPFHSGARFSAKAAAPSRASSLFSTGPRISPWRPTCPPSSSRADSTITCLLARTASGPFAPMRAASSRAPSRAPPAGVRWLTSPHRCASAALIGSPVSASSMATVRGMRAGRRIRPPAAAASPRLTSGIPNVASSEATTRSQDSTSSHPPASAGPSTAAISGFDGGRWVMPANPRSPTCGRSPRRKALRSMPALKNPPAPVRMPATSASSSSSSSSAAAIPSATAVFTEFRAFGRSMVMISVVPSRSVRRTGSSPGQLIAGPSGSRRRAGSSRR